MASRDIANMHFFLDLKKRFPYLPDDLLRNHVSLYSEDQEKCISLLQKESQNHHHLSTQPFSDFRLPEANRRKDGNKDAARSMPLYSSPTPLFVKPESRSAPVIQSTKQPFTDMYRQNSVSSQNHGQTMFLTTKEHKVGLSEPRTDPIHGGHTVKLSITPSFPFQQQQQLGISQRHTTSVNFQLQHPRSSSDQRPFVISTIPTNVANPGRTGSHVQISVGSQGATFTALRFQHSSPLPAEQSSQAQNSFFPNKSPKSGTSSRNSAAQYHPAQPSASYILAVKNEQIAQLDSIVDKLEKEKALCSQLRAEVSKLEGMVENNVSKTSSFLCAQKMNELREENKQLRTECNCLCIETDMYGSDEIPPCETEDFYSCIFTGPNGAVLPITKDSAKSEMRSKGRSKSDEEDVQNRWVCKKCTFANYPALEECEMCEVPKDIDSFFDGN